MIGILVFSWGFWDKFFIIYDRYFLCFLDGIRFFLNADSDRGFAPMAGESRIGADFFLDLGWCRLAVRMGADGS